MKARAVIGALALAAIGFCFWWHFETNAKLNATIASLEARLREAESQNDKQKSALENSERELVRLKTVSSEMPKLRGEVASLKRDLVEKETALAARPKEIALHESNPEKPKILAFGAEAQDLGATTPERAATSLIWAAGSGDRARLSELLELPPGIPAPDAPRHYEHFANLLSNKFAHLEFTGISYVRPNADGTLRLGIEYRDLETGNTAPFPFMMRNHEGAWKVVVEGPPPKNF